MTDEERDLTLEYLKEMQEKYIEGYGYEAHPLPEWYALDEAIKALAQQPFINKPCVSEGVCREDKIQVLDKIRAEIDDIEEGISSYHNDRPWVFKDEVLRVIDKYREGGVE